MLAEGCSKQQNNTVQQRLLRTAVAFTRVFFFNGKSTVVVKNVDLLVVFLEAYQLLYHGAKHGAHIHWQGVYLIQQQSDGTMT